MMAVKMFFWFKGVKTEAVRGLRRLKEEDTPTNLGDLVDTWSQRFIAEGSVRDHPHPGRHGKVPMAVAHQCAHVLAAGVEEKDGEVRHYGSYKTACEVNPLFELVMAEYGVGEQALMNAMKAAEPDLGRKKEQLRAGFSELNKKTRQSIAVKHDEKYEANPNYYFTWIHVDEASAYLSAIDARTVWCLKHADVPVVHSRKLADKCKDHCKWYIAVSPLLGVFGPLFTTGTTGQPHIFPVGGQNPGGGTQVPNTSLNNK